MHVRLHDWSNKDILDGIRDGRLQLGLISSSPKASSLRDLRYEELFHERVCVAVAPQHPFARRRAVPLTEVAAEPLIGLTREDYPNYYDYLSIIVFEGETETARRSRNMTACPALFRPSKREPASPLVRTFWLQFRKPSKVLHLTPEPKPFSVGIVATKGRLSPAAEKFWQCAREAASAKNSRLSALKSPIRGVVCNPRLQDSLARSVPDVMWLRTNPVTRSPRRIPTTRLRRLSRDRHPGA